MKIKRALRVGTQMILAFTGAGGKTTAMFRLARELAPPVLVTTTTHLGAWQTHLADHHFIIKTTGELLEAVRQPGLVSSGVTLFTSPPGKNNRLEGPGEASLALLRDFSRDIGAPLLIEADGSRQKPLKAPGEHEPVVPDWVDGIAVLAGLAGLGQPLGADVVHRPERFAALAGLREGDPIDTSALASVLIHPQGGLQGLPAGARRALILNQADDPGRLALAQSVAGAARSSYDSVLIASLLTDEPVIAALEPCAGIVLAAGGASRFGSPKMLLEWRGQPLVRRAAQSALDGGLAPVVVVVGDNSSAVRAALTGLDVIVIENHDWREGQSTSLRLGLIAAMQARLLGSVAFLLADQPFVTSEVVRALVEEHSRSLAEVVAPRVNGRRANPVLFDRAVFDELLALTGDTGGRAIFGRYPPAWVAWPDERLLFDIDTPDDYRRLKGME